MMQWTRWMCGVAVAALLAAPVLAKPNAEGQQPGNKEGKQKAEGEKKEGRGQALRGEYAALKDCGLSDDQKDQLQAILKQYAEKKAEWQKENGEQMKELQEALKQAHEAKDKEKVREIQGKQAELRKGLLEIEVGQRQAVSALLTPEQKQCWEGAKLSNSMLGQFKKVKLDDKQQMQIRELCAAATAQYTEADAKAKGEMRKELIAKIKADVLTDEQREMMSRKPEKKEGEQPKAGKGKNKDKGGEAAE